MDILQNIDTSVSSMVSSSFDEFISTKVKDAVEKEKEKFLADLNMCEEEYPQFDESKHKKFEACKLVNDNSLDYQDNVRRVKLNICDEFILTDIDIGKIHQKGGHWYGGYLTNKGNIYVNNFIKSYGGFIKYNYKILDYIGYSSCSGPAIHAYVNNGRWDFKGIIERSTVKSSLQRLPEKEVDKKTDDFMKNVKGNGCRYRCDDLQCNLANIIIKRNRQWYDTSIPIKYKDNIGWREDSIERFLTNNICPECRSGEVIPEKLDPDINIEIFRNPPIFNVEYIELLELLSKKGVTIPIYQIQTIYAKYHPRANENFVIEEKIKKLSQIEKVVEERVEEEKNSLEKQKEIYSEKVKQVNEEKLKRIFSMFILRNERKENIKDKSTIREMIKRSNDKCKKKEQEQEINLEKQRNILNLEKTEFEKEKEKFYEEKIEYENTFKSKVKSLLDMANDINEINELQDDTLCKSEELFSIMKRLNEFI